MSTYTIMSMSGADLVTDGLTDENVHEIAQRIANERRENVQICTDVEGAEDCEFAIVKQKRHWTTLQLLDDSGETMKLSRTDRAHYLRELRATGEMTGVFLAREDDQSFDHPDEWGPSIDDINWTGIDDA